MSKMTSKPIGRTVSLAADWITPASLLTMHWYTPESDDTKPRILSRCPDFSTRKYSLLTTTSPFLNHLMVSNDEGSFPTTSQSRTTSDCALAMTELCRECRSRGTADNTSPTLHLHHLWMNATVHTSIAQGPCNALCKLKPCQQLHKLAKLYEKLQLESFTKGENDAQDHHCCYSTGHICL